MPNSPARRERSSVVRAACMADMLLSLAEHGHVRAFGVRLRKVSPDVPLWAPPELVLRSRGPSGSPLFQSPSGSLIAWSHVQR